MTTGDWAIKRWGRWATALLLMGAGARAQMPPADPAPVPKPLSRPVRICAGGDVTLGTNLDTVWARAGADTLWRFYHRRPDPDSLAPALKPFLAGADVVLLNIEGAIGEGPAPQKCGPWSTSCYAFRQPRSTAAALRRLVDTTVAMVGNVANNHARDAGNDGRDSTVAALIAAGIVPTGNDTVASPVGLSWGDTIAFLGFHTDTAAPDARDLAKVRRLVRRAVKQYGTVIVTMHLGAEGVKAQRTQNASEHFLAMNRGNPVAFADAAFAGGAALVVGHGPHVLRAIQWRRNRLVAYSLGNLLTYGPFRLKEPTNRGAVLCATIDAKHRVSHVELRATMQRWPGVLQADSSRRAFALIDSLSALDFPRTGARVSSKGGVLRRRR